MNSLVSGVCVEQILQERDLIENRTARRYRGFRRTRPSAATVSTICGWVLMRRPPDREPR